MYGCADVNIPEGAWYKRDGDFATVGCESEDMLWRVICEGTEWKGTIGSCSVDSEYCEHQLINFYCKHI